MMQENSQPLAVLYGYQSNKNELSFNGRNGVITLRGKSSEIKKVLCLCNGLNSVQDITRQLLLVSSEEITELLSLCEAQGIVRDSRDLHIGFHEDSSNPMNFSRDIGVEELEHIIKSNRLRRCDGIATRLSGSITSDVLKVIQNRQSTRQFQDSQIPMNQLSGLLEAVYSTGKNGHWSVPSGGGMYPLDIYLIVPGNRQVLPGGIYQWSPERAEVVTVSDKSPSVWLPKVFNAKTLLENAAYILCIATNLNRSASKYANRGYRLTLLEAGHAAQNAYLFCAEQNIGVVECCGFSDKALAQKLGLKFPDEAVITTLIVGIAENNGKQTSDSDEQMSVTAGQLRHALVGENKPITDVSFLEPEVSGYSMPRWSAIAVYRPPAGRPVSIVRKRNRAFATGLTSNEVVIKVLAEGFERYALEQNRVDLVESAIKLHEPFLDPRIVVPYAQIQRKMLGSIGQFDPHKKIEWIAGVREVDDGRVWVPVELVFFASKCLQKGRKLCYWASSNGVAAHFDKQIAIETAVYELVERDAFSVMWYAKRSVCSIPHRFLSDDLRSRISCWEQLGYKVSLLDLTLDGPPVVLALIWSQKKKPALSSGAGCRATVHEAINRAFDEAEFMAMTWHNRRLKPNMQMSDVKSTDDHGLFYADPRNLVHAKWLLETVDCSVIRNDFVGNLRCFDPIVVDITPKENPCGLKVVRVLSEKLMPINFGYGNEHRGHSRMDILQYKWSMGYPSTPHFFA